MIHENCKIGVGVKIGHGVVIDEGCIIGDNVFIGHNTIIREHCRIQSNVVIGHLCLIEKMTKIGYGTVVQSQCHITAMADIGERCYFGPSVTIINEWRISKWRNRVMKQELRGPKIGQGCRIGAKSLIMPGVVIGENAVVGAGSTITKDIADREIWIGPQAEMKGMVPENEFPSEVAR